MEKKKNFRNSASTISPPEADPPLAGAWVEMKVVTQSALETQRLGVRLGKLLRVGDVVTISGPLGAGKTTLVKGVVRGAGSKDSVTSPTFTLIHEYQGRQKIYHMDWYRLKKVTSVDRQMAEECFAQPAVTLVEWPERGKAILPKHSISIRISHTGKNKRKISWKGIAI